MSVCLAGSGVCAHHRPNADGAGVSSPSGQACLGTACRDSRVRPLGTSGRTSRTRDGTVMPTRPAAQRVRLKVDLLGRLDARTADGRPIRLPGRHAQALFALLVLARRPRSREAIAADLWPDADGTSAGSLRQALWLVRQGLAEAGYGAGEVLDIEADTVGIRLDATI